MTFSSLENAISASNPIRFIDVYVENVDLRILGFDVRTLKSKRRTQFNHAGLQHETQYNYFWGTQFNCQTQELEVALKDQSLAFSKNGLFNLETRLCFLPNQICSLKLNLLKRTYLSYNIDKLSGFYLKNCGFSMPDVGGKCRKNDDALLITTKLVRHT